MCRGGSGPFPLGAVAFGDGGAYFEVGSNRLQGDVVGLILEGGKGAVVAGIDSGGMAAINVSWDQNDIAMRTGLVVEHRSHGEESGSSV